jgi:hypothetical protein
VSSSSYTYQYVYNGLGDRVRSVLEGVATTYVLDLNQKVSIFGLFENPEAIWLKVNQ